ncbi:MAG TPA: DNA-binding protein [Clostridiales bacterium]|nr:DNA-binding protein [Clostridiales bacterium]
MEYKKFGNKYLIRMDKGEEIVENLKKFCQDHNITLGWIKGIGAVSKAKIGLLRIDEKKYYSTELDGAYEITSLLGNVTTMKGEVYLHLHINLSDEDNKTYGGHLNYAIISATGEIFIEAVDGMVDREYSDEVGINLIKFD